MAAAQEPAQAHHGRGNWNELAQAEEAKETVKATDEPGYRGDSLKSCQIKYLKNIGSDTLI